MITAIRRHSDFVACTRRAITLSTAGAWLPVTNGIHLSCRCDYVVYSEFQSPCCAFPSQVLSSRNARKSFAKPVGPRPCRRVDSRARCVGPFEAAIVCASSRQISWRADDSVWQADALNDALRCVFWGIVFNPWVMLVVCCHDAAV